MQKIELGSRFELFRGCVSSGVRMSQDLLGFYNDSDARVIRARSATGVRIVFQTDASEMTLFYTFGGTARKIFATDVVVNGEVISLEGEGPHNISMKTGEKNVVIHLPHLVVVEKIELAVSDGAFVKAVPEERKKLLICGDSILQGMTCTTPTKAVGTLLAEKLNWDFHNTSVGGADMRFEPVEYTIALGGDAIMVCFGINDIPHGTTPELFRERVKKVLELLDGFSGKSFIIAPISNIKIGPEQREPFSDIIREEKSRFPRVTLIEGAEIVPAREELFVDGTHPNNEGMAIYAEGLFKIIGPCLG